MRLRVETNDGQLVASWSDTDHISAGGRWHGPLPSADALASATCTGNRAGSSLVSGLRRAMQDAEAVEAGRDPERPSERAMRLSERTSEQKHAFASALLDNAIKRPTREQIRDFADAHAEGLHDDAPREFCPECDRQRGRA